MSAPRRARLRIATLLLVIVAVPTLGMLGFAVADAVVLVRTVRAADELTAGTREFSALLEARAVVYRERIPAEALATATQLGGTFDDRLGLELARDIELARAELDDDPTVGRLLDAGARRERLERTRALVDRGDITRDGVALVYDEIHALIDDESAATIAMLVDEANDLGAEGVVRAAAMADRTIDSVSTGLPMMAEVARLLVPLGTPERRAFADLLRLDTRNRSALDTLVGSLGPRATSAYDEFVADPQAARFDKLVEARLASTVPVEDDRANLDLLAQAFADGLKRQQLLVAVSQGAAKDLADEAAAVRGDALSDLRTSVVIGTAVTVGAIAIAGAIATSIVRPLRRLEARVHEVGEGSLTGEPLVADGPREVAVTITAVNELVATLGRVEDQVAALAEGNLGAESLSRPAPGRIGALLHDTMDRLSSSLRAQDELQQMLRHEASHDALTGLMNRRAAMASLDRALARTRRSGEPTAVLFIDLDGFKRSNDLYGHDAGDAVLVEVARRLTNEVRSSDVVARLGGDEFLVIADPVAGPQEAVALAERIAAALRRPHLIGTDSIDVGGSVGVAMMHDGVETGTDLLRDADHAVYRVKAEQRGGVCLFDDRLMDEVRRRASTERELATAVGAGELVLHYQPIVNAVDKTLCGLEALVRWERPGHGLLAPGAFLPDVARSAVMVDLSRWVLAAALDQAARWTHTPGLGDVAIAVNVSRLHVLGPTFIDDVTNALVIAGVEPARLCLEITEELIAEDLGVVGERLSVLRELGVSVAIDDFGAGTSSVATLRRVPADALKIDRSLVEHADNPTEAGFIELLASVGHLLGVAVVGEGIESEEMAQRLADLGCDRLQGYLFARPLPAADVERRWAGAVASGPGHHTQ